ncbi:MAG TPA: glycosyltransferase family 2 protein [Candidatus Saccharimonadales bacterium]
MHAISIIIPSYNNGSWLPSTISHLTKALQAAQITDYEIIVVNDGSTDNTSQLLADIARDDAHLVVINQENKGRFLSRKVGIQKASKEYVLFLDSRIDIDEGSFKYVKEQMARDPKLIAWNGHVRIKLGWNVFARFWDTVTFIAWRRYLRRPKLTQFGLEDFDYYPKGTGFFLAPRKLLEKHIDAFKSNIEDMKFVSDDTALLRGVAEEVKITIAPEFSCLYYSRDRLKPFIKHTLNRGTFFVDGFLQPGNRYFILLLGFLAATPIGIVLLILWPTLILSVLGIMWVMGLLAALVLGTPPASALSFWLLSPLFAVLYGIGIWRGVLMIVLQKLSGKGSTGKKAAS